MSTGLLNLLRVAEKEYQILKTSIYVAIYTVMMAEFKQIFDWVKATIEVLGLKEQYEIQKWDNAGVQYFIVNQVLSLTKTEKRHLCDFLNEHGAWEKEWIPFPKNPGSVWDSTPPPGSHFFVRKEVLLVRSRPVAHTLCACLIWSYESLRSLRKAMKSTWKSQT